MASKLSRLFKRSKPKYIKPRLVVVPFWRMEEEVPMMSQVGNSLQNPLPNKVSIVGVGQVGMACAFSLLTMNVADEIALTDVVGDKLKGEVLDLQHAAAFTRGVKIMGDEDFAVTKDSKICIITAGARQKEGQTRIELLEQNIKILQNIIPKTLQYSPDAILVIVTNPVDVLTYAAWKISGRPLNSIFGTGTSLDTARLKVLIAQRIGLSTQSVHGWIIGEHGDASVPVWSNLQIGGVSLQDFYHPSKIRNEDTLDELHSEITNSAYEIIKLKGYTSWAIGLNVADICKSILHNTHQLHAVSTLVKGFHGVEDEVFLSLPCVLAAQGISHIIPLVLNDKEKEEFKNASIKMYSTQSLLNI